LFLQVDIFAANISCVMKTNRDLMQLEIRLDLRVRDESSIENKEFSRAGLKQWRRGSPKSLGAGLLQIPKFGGFYSR
jgi:hypothetical protein